MKATTRPAVLIALTVISGAASAQGIVATSTSDRWAGFYVGVNGGVAISTTCNTWEANGPLAGTALFNNRDCPNKTAGVGGVQIGYDFQTDQIVWGFGLDYDFYSAKSKTKSLVYSGPTFPDGTYTFSGKNSPSGFGILGPRIGYALDNWLPYIRAGGVFTSGKSNLSATAPNGAIFDGGKDYKSHGFGVGAGVDYALPESWSIRAEYTYVNLGKGSNSLTGCTGSTAACDAYAGLSLDNIHNSFTFSIIRIGVNYEF